MPLLQAIFKKVFFALLLGGNTITLYAQDPSPKHYQVKAVFLYNFTQFVEWPPPAFPAVDAPWVIGIMGEDPFGAYLKEVIDGEQIHGHPLTVRVFEPGEEVKGCHVLFVNLPHPDQTAHILKKLHGQNILTVSDQADFLEAGGMIRFISVDDKIQFQINPEASSAADLKISSKLLRLAEIVLLPKE